MDEPPAAHARPRRWLVLGGSGAGKSVFSQELGRRLGLPVIHLDRHYWHPGWVETPRPEWRGKAAELAARDAWVMDGNYSNSLDVRLPRAQAVVLLDLPPWTTVHGIFRRYFRAQPRPDLAAGCTEKLPDLDFVWWSLSYRWRSLPRVLRRVAEYPELPFHRLRSRRAMRAFLDALPAVPDRGPAAGSSPTTGVMP